MSATYYVAQTNGAASDGNPGTEAQPWETIGHAVATATNGDTVYVYPGTYNEYLTNSASGSDGSPITFIGVRDGSGEWLTIVDPSTIISNGWVNAAWVGTNVYAYTNSFIPCELTIDNKRVACLADMGTIDNAGNFGGAPSTGVGWLTLASNAQVTISLGSVEWWNSIQAAWCATNTTVYLRMRDSSNPEGLNIRAAPNVTTVNDRTVVRAAIRNTGQSYITWRNFKIRGAFSQMLLTGANTHHVIVESNYLSTGFSRLSVVNGAHDNVIRYNHITMDYYGYDDPGAWDVDINRENLYRTAKYLMTTTHTSFDEAVELDGAGTNNSVYGNQIYKGVGQAIGVGGTNTLVYANAITNFSSIGINTGIGQTGVRIYDNYIGDCNINLRFQNLAEPGESGVRLAYIFRNRSWLVTGAGAHIFLNWSDPSTPSAFNPEHWFYHNSFSGGGIAFQTGSYQEPVGGMTNFHLINNIFSCPISVFTRSYTNAEYFGTFDYNVVTNYSASWIWYGTNNILLSSNQWPNVQGMTFALPSDSQAIDAAIDTTTTMTLEGQVYPALPQDDTVKVGSSWDIGALEYSPPPIVITNRAQYTEDLWIK